MTVKTKLYILALVSEFALATIPNISWSEKNVYSEAQVDSTNVVWLSEDYSIAQLCWANITNPEIPAGECTLIKVSNMTNLIYGKETTFQTVNGTDPFTLPLQSIPGRDAMIAYTHGNDSQTGTGVLLNSFKFDSELTYDNAVTFNDQPNDQSTMVSLFDGNSFAVCYSSGSNDKRLDCRVVVRDSSTGVMTLSEPVTVYQGSSTDGLGMLSLSASEFVMCYSTGLHGLCNIVSVHTSSNTFKMEVSVPIKLNDAPIDEVSFDWLQPSSSTLIVCFNNGATNPAKGTCSIGHYVSGMNSSSPTISFLPSDRSDYWIKEGVDETNVLVLHSLPNTPSLVLVCFVYDPNRSGQGACTSASISTTISTKGFQLNWSRQLSVFNSNTSDEINLLQITGTISQPIIIPSSLSSMTQFHLLICYVNITGGACNLGTLSTQ